MNDYSEATVRRDVRQWLEAHWTPDQSLIDWRNTLIDSGWGVPTWPKNWYGLDLPEGLAPVVQEEMARIGAVGVAKVGIRSLAASTLLVHGSDSQKERFLRRSLTGEDTWCQLFSEPGSGSDLAGVTTRAEPNGGDWVVNGQKVWTTSAHHADWGLLLARTDWDVPKHRGLSFFVIDMKQSGIETRPILQMNGFTSFYEVFLTDTIVPANNLVSNSGNGWAVATTTLMYERMTADELGRWGVKPHRDGRIYDEERTETALVMAPYAWYPQRAGRADMIVERARQTGRIAEPAVRQEVAKLLTLVKSGEWTSLRARAARVQGRAQGPEGSLGKLVSSAVAREAARVHTLVTQAGVMLDGEDAPLDGLIAQIILSVPASSIAGGTDEIQRNIIAEQVLGMPKEPRPDAKLPFREVRRNSAASR